MVQSGWAPKVWTGKFNSKSGYPAFISSISFKILFLKEGRAVKI